MNEYNQFLISQVNNYDFSSISECISNRKVFIWGADWKGEEIAKNLANCGIDIEGYIDSTVSGYINLKPVLRPTDILLPGSAEENYIIVSMLLKHKNEVIRILHDAGYSNDDYLYCSANWNFIQEDIGVCNTDWIEEKYSNGKMLAESLEASNFYILLWGGHIGDEVIALSWMGEFKKRNRIKHLNVITSSLYAGLAELYAQHFDKIIVWEREELEALRIYTTDRRRIHFNIIGGSWRWLPKDRCVPSPMAQIAYKSIHLGLPYNTKSEYISGFGENDNTVQQIIKMNGIKKKKSIILIPYAKSARMLPVSFWEHLVKHLSDQYVFFTNVAGDEVPIKGSRALNVPLKYMIDISNYAGHVISIRCGLTDLLALGQCNVQVIYAVENEVDSNYAKVNSQYVNGTESVLFKNAFFIKPEENDDSVLNRLIAKITN